MAANTPRGSGAAESKASRLGLGAPPQTRRCPGKPPEEQSKLFCGVTESNLKSMPAHRVTVLLRPAEACCGLLRPAEAC